MKKRIQRVELNKYYDVSIYCPFCGQKVVDMEAQGDEMTLPCPHTIFIANDEGFEYRSELFDKSLGLVGVDNDKIQLPESGIDGLTDQLSISDAIKLAAYVGPPSGLGSYVGFAPHYD